MTVEINGAKIIYTIPVLGGINITLTMILSFAITIILACVMAWATHDLKEKDISKRQAAVEWLYNFVDGLVVQNMGEKWRKIVPYIGTVMIASITQSLSSLLGFFPPTGEVMSILAWGITFFVILTRTKIKTQGLGPYLKGYLEPVFIMAPFNVLGELFRPVSMSFRHFGNVLSGVVITSLVYAALGAANSALFGLIPGKIGELLGVVPVLELGVPAVLSLYFDWFSGAIQAYIFATLIMMFVGQASEA